MRTNKHYIYELICPITNNTRYIGQTIDPKARYKKHILDAKYSDFHSRVWVKSLLNKGLKPIMNVIDESDESSIDTLEKMYITLYRTWGMDLTNISLGGQKSKVFSIETRNKISNSLKGKVQSEETKKKRSQSLKKTWENPELRELKRKQTTELNRLGIIGTKGKPSPKKGIKLTKEHIEKTTNALKKYYKINKPYNYIKFEQYIIDNILEDYYMNNMPKLHIAQKYNINRCHIYKILRENENKQ